MRAIALTIGLALAMAACAPGEPPARPSASIPAPAPTVASGGRSGSPAPGGLPPSAATPPRIATPARGALPTPAPTLVFAVLEASGTAARLNPGIGDTPDTVAIVGLDGVARARASFTPRSLVFVGNAAPIQGPVARTAAGAVFYGDGAGALSKMDAAGTVSKVATFPLTDPQQQLRFAVSPDGTAVLATTIAFPPKHDPPPDNPSQPAFKEGAHWLVALDRADAGGVTRVYSRDLGAQFPTDVPTVAGWINGGPLIGSAELGTQQAPFDLIGAMDVHFADLSGNPGPALGGAGCVAQSFTAAGEVLCSARGDTPTQVRGSGGVPEWNLPPDCQWPVSSFQQMWSISPGGTRVASALNVCSRDGSVIRLPARFHPQGWLDDNTLIGTAGDLNLNELAIVRLSDPAVVDDLGFKGEFVGVVRS